MAEVAWVITKVSHCDESVRLILFVPDNCVHSSRFSDNVHPVAKTKVRQVQKVLRLDVQGYWCQKQN